MLDAEALVCTDCGNAHVAGAVGPDYIEECVVCGGDVTDVELEDLVSL